MNVDMRERLIDLLKGFIEDIDQYARGENFGAGNS